MLAEIKKQKHKPITFVSPKIKYKLTGTFNFCFSWMKFVNCFITKEYNKKDNKKFFFGQ